MGNRPLWLIVKQRCSGLEVLTTGAYVLPVFSFREEVETFLHFLKDPGDDWQARETTCGELVSVLYGLCRDIEHVSLDPLMPGIVELTSFSRKAFVKALHRSDASSSVEEKGMEGVAF
jgi:hypothetical protein